VDADAEVGYRVRVRSTDRRCRIDLMLDSTGPIVLDVKLHEQYLSGTYASAKTREQWQQQATVGHR
jgi:hypothetical protein